MAENNKRDSNKPQKQSGTEKPAGSPDRTRQGANPNKDKMAAEVPPDRNRQGQNSPGRPVPDKAQLNDDLDLDLDDEDDRTAPRSDDGQG